MELLVAGLYMVATDLQKALQGPSHHRYFQLEPSVALIDVTVSVSLFVIAARHPQLWLLTSAALQFITVFAHVARTFQSTMPRAVYEILMGSGGYPLVTILFMAIWRNALNGQSRSNGQL